MPSIPPPTTFRPPAPSSGEPERVSRVLRFGAVVGAGVIAAALAAIPAAMRVAAAAPAGGRTAPGGTPFCALFLPAVAAAAVPAGAAPASSPVPASTGALFIDLLAFGIAIGFLSRAEFARRHVLAWLGLPVAVGMIT